MSWLASFKKGEAERWEINELVSKFRKGEAKE